VRMIIPLLLLSACGDKAADDSGLCAGAPVVTWENFGAGFIVERCQTCHASTSPNRNDAPEEVTFDTEEQVQAWADRILARVLDDANPMPPQGGVDDDDLTLLETWLGCADTGEM
jgi:uncharacterized membrane protein